MYIINTYMHEYININTYVHASTHKYIHLCIQVLSLHLNTYLPFSL